MKLEYEQQLLFTKIINKWGLPIVENENNWEFTNEDKMCLKNEYYCFFQIFLFLFITITPFMLKYYTLEKFTYCFLTKNNTKRSHGIMIKNNKVKFHWMENELC